MKGLIEHRLWLVCVVTVICGLTALPGCPGPSDGGSGDGTDGSTDGGGGTDGGQGGDTIISDQTRLLNDSITIETLDDTHLRLSGGDLPSLYPGNVIVSAANGGLLARVKSVSQDGGLLTLETEPAALTDIIQTGQLEIHDKLDMSRARLAFPPGSKLARTMKNEGGVLAASEFSLELGDKATVTVKDISFDFSPGFDFLLNIEDWVVQQFRCTASGQASVAFTAEVEVNAVTEFLEKKVQLFELSWPEPAGILVIGGIVPIVWEFFMEVELGAGVYADNVGTFGADFSASTGILAGAEYNRTGDNRGWQPIGDFTFNATADAGDWNVAPVRAKVFIKPEFGIRFFKVAGPSISYEEYLELAGDYRFDELGAELRNGREINLNFTFKIIDPVKFQWSHNLYEGRDVLMARLAYGVDPSDLGSIFYDPLGALNFYWHTVNVDVWAEPILGYELGGYSIRHLLSNRKRIEKTDRLEDEPVDASKLIMAHFVPEGEGDDWTGSGISASEGTHTVTTEVFPPAAGRIVLFPTLQKYHIGDNLITQAIANSGFVFHHWEGAAEGTEPVTTSRVPGNCTVKAVFASEPPRTLRVPNDYATLQDAIDAATYNDIIELGAGTFTGDGNRDLDFEDRSFSDRRYADNVTIRGQGCGVTIIDLEGTEAEPHRLAAFGDPEGTIRFESLTIRNGYHTYDGGALEVIDSMNLLGEGLTSLEIVNCCFENCRAGRDGAAICYGDPDKDQHLYVQNSTFTNCGGAFAIHVECDYNEMEVVVTGCTFSGNTGALAISPLLGRLTIADSTFTGNLTYSAVGLGYVMQGTISNCVFSGNQAGQNGSALGCATSTVTVTDCTFTGNGVSGQNYAGAVWTRDQVTFEDCTFTGNSSNIGGAVALGEGGIMRNCTFDGNQAVHDGGALYLAGYASDCTFTNNTAGDEGGAIEMYDGTLEGATVIGNTARLWGGGIDARGGTISGCLVQNNQCNGAGGIRMQDGVVRNCTVIDNTATELGRGGIMAEGSSVYACTVRGNRAIADGGGGMLAENSLVSGCLIENNAADEEGGGMVVRDSTISNCVVQNNTAAEGGGIWCWRTSSTVEHLYDVTLTGNTPDECRECTDCP